MNSVHVFLIMFVIIRIFTELITSVNAVMNFIRENCSPHFSDTAPLTVYKISKIVLYLGIPVATILSGHLNVLELKELGNSVQKFC